MVLAVGWSTEMKKKKKKAGEPLKRGNVPCICEKAGAAQTAMLEENNWGRCNVSPSHLRALVSTPPHTGAACIQSAPFFPALTQMR